MLKPGGKAKLKTQQEAGSTKYFFFLKRKLSTGPYVCSLLAPFAGYGLIPTAVAIKTMYIP